MYIRPEDLARAHQSDLLDEACRDRRGAHGAWAERRRHAVREAASRARRTPPDPT